MFHILLLRNKLFKLNHLTQDSTVTNLEYLENDCYLTKYEPFSLTTTQSCSKLSSCQSSQGGVNKKSPESIIRGSGVPALSSVAWGDYKYYYCGWYASHSQDFAFCQVAADQQIAGTQRAQGKVSFLRIELKDGPLNLESRAHTNRSLRTVEYSRKNYEEGIKPLFNPCTPLLPPSHPPKKKNLIRPPKIP